MADKLKIEPIVKEIVHDFPTQYMIQLELQDIYNSIDNIRKETSDGIEPTIVYVPQWVLEDSDEITAINLEEEFDYDDI